MTAAVAETDFDKIVKNIRNKLPIQNPLPTFVHNNILLMFEGKDFHEALTDAGELYRARTYWPLERYRARFEEGKMTEDDISEALTHYLGKYSNFPVLEKLGITPKDFLYRLMFSDLAFNNDEVQPQILDKHLWDSCQEKMSGQELTLRRSSVKWRGKEYWEKYHNENYTLSVLPFVFRLVSSYLDQGQSFWSNPFVNKGFWTFASFDILETKNFLTGWQKNLAVKVKSYEHESSDQIIQKELQKMGVPQDVWEKTLLEILFDMKGWSGMVNKLELEPWQATVKSPSIKLLDYLALLVLIESSMNQFHAHEASIDMSLIIGRQEKVEMKSFQLSLALYQITKYFKLDSHWMKDLSSADLLKVVDDIDELEHTHKIRVWHEAYEHHFYREALSAIVQHGKEVKAQTPARPYAQVLFCIDDREESIRRHLEEVDHGVQTFGVVGFFGLDMKFSSLKNQRLIAQCPPVINPSRVVREISVDQEKGKGFDKFNHLLGGSGLFLYYYSRTLFRGFFATLLLGVLSLVPMFLAVFFPKQSQTFKAWLKEIFSTTPKTQIVVEKGEGDSGYTVQEQAKIVEAIVRMCGLKPPFAPLVVMAAHGSSSTNNPFRQAYGCGACGGNAGVPNSRAFSKMGNDLRVREELKKAGLELTDSTIFISAYHDTCADEVHYFDLENLPPSHMKDLEILRKNFNEACKLNAYERCQRFSSETAKNDPDEALKHVRERAQDLAQPRPEYGHCTTALSILGKRDLTRGLFLNRRSFLISYDWETDSDDGKTLFQAVIGAIPVCVNINMDYYFSCVDNDNFGCGSKLPLNPTSLLGVMTGSQGDLRIGLARQMVELHEPIRNLTIVEAPLSRVKSVFDSHPRLRNILYHHWLRMVVYDPTVQEWYIYGQNDWRVLNAEKFKMKHFKTSFEIIQNTHSNEDFAEIDE
jgi:uncharacterized protein YbcC (UPF0753/DUF2309 family)